MGAPGPAPGPADRGRGLRIRKGLVLLFCATALGLQLAALIAGPGVWYWPFVDYRMYAAAYPAGSSFSFYELRAIPCSAASPAEVLDHTALRFMPSVLGSVLAGGARGDARQLERLGRAVGSAGEGRFCRAEIWSRTHRIGEQGLESATAEPRLERAWELGAARAAGRTARGRQVRR